jgi:lysophospholipid acyltransferase (LPLAT)-like uncharacterized protein
VGKLIKVRWRLIRPELVSGLAFIVLRALGSTLRVITENFPRDDSKSIICGWHGRSLLFGNLYRNRGYWVVISQSRDGDIQNHIFTKLGFRTIRGSTGRGGARAAIEAIRALRDGGTMAMTPDGPRGPSHIVQGGVMLMALKSGAALIPVGISAKPRLLIKSWDRFMVPVPFARGMMIFGEPVTVPDGADEEAVEAVRKELESEMIRLECEAERRLGHRPIKMVQ